jgi:hypothetical protein
MYRYLSERLMTIEEARALSELETAYEERQRRERIWSWQSVDGLMQVAEAAEPKRERRQ